MSPPRILAKLDLSSERERHLHNIFERCHSGRWPLLGVHALRRVGDALYELAEWSPKRRHRALPSFCVLEWNIASLGLRWRNYSTLEAARAAFEEAAGSLGTVALMEGGAA